LARIFGLVVPENPEDFAFVGQGAIDGEQRRRCSGVVVIEEEAVSDVDVRQRFRFSGVHAWLRNSFVYPSSASTSRGPGATIPLEPGAGVATVIAATGSAPTLGELEDGAGLVDT
jgi:hypothetical protein